MLIHMKLPKGSRKLVCLQYVGHVARYGKGNSQKGVESVVGFPQHGSLHNYCPRNSQKGVERADVITFIISFKDWGLTETPKRE